MADEPTESATLSVPAAAELLGISRNAAYQHASRDGHLAGVPIIRIGRRLLVPTALLREALGLSTERIPDGQEK